MLWYEQMNLVFPSVAVKMEVRQFWIARQDYYYEQGFHWDECCQWAIEETKQKYSHLVSTNK